ncbi:MAG: hypothetical protein ACRDT1_01820 [Micromonosporaceae bacterium]
MNAIKPYLKAIVGAGVAGLSAVAAALADDSVSVKEWVAVATAALVGLGAVWGVPNLGQSPSAAKKSAKKSAESPAQAD